MRKIDEEHLERPWLGVPRITEWIRKDVGIKVNPKRIERLFKLLEIAAIYPKPKTSKRGKGEDYMGVIGYHVCSYAGRFLIPKCHYRCI
jgi:putative transposase